MAVYVDNASILYKGKPRHHLTADSFEELHQFCAKLDIKRCWFHSSAKRHPHYDITDPQREAALQSGALQVDGRILMHKALTLGLTRGDRKLKPPGTDSKEVG